jgi:hypothetical protein
MWLETGRDNPCYPIFIFEKLKMKMKVVIFESVIKKCVIEF